MGENNPKSRADVKIDKILELNKNGMTAGQIAEYFNCSRQYIMRRVKGKVFINWNNVKGYYSRSEATKKKIGQNTSLARKGKTWEEIFGVGKAKILKEKLVERGKKLFKSGFNPSQGEKARRKISEKAKLRLKDPNRLREALTFLGQNGQEHFIEKLLHGMGYGYRFVGDGKVNIDGKCPDFILGKKIIEFFGRHWHKEKEERERINFFKRFGYETLVLWSEELKDIPTLRKKIEVFNRA